MAIKSMNINQTMKHPKEIAFTILMVSWVMLFAALFLAYALLRFKEPQWPPMGFEQVSLKWPLISTIFVCTSSFTLFLFSKNFKSNVSKAKKYLYSTIFLGVGFLVSQKLLWNEMNATGLDVGSGTFASIIQAFSWVHAAHIVMGIIGLTWLLSFAEKTDDLDFNFRVIHVSKFWHFLDIVWILMFVTMFLI